MASVGAWVLPNRCAKWGSCGVCLLDVLDVRSPISYYSFKNLLRDDGVTNKSCFETLGGARKVDRPGRGYLLSKKGR